MFSIYLHHGPQLWEVKYQPGKVTRISYLPHDCPSNCSSFSHLQGLMGGPGVRDLGIRWTRTPPSRPYNPQCLSMLLIHVCLSQGVTPHFSLNIFPLSLCSTCQFICSSRHEEIFLTWPQASQANMIRAWFVFPSIIQLLYVDLELSSSCQSKFNISCLLWHFCYSDAR